MAISNQELKIILTAVDQATAPMKAATTAVQQLASQTTAATTKMSQSAAATGNVFSKLGSDIQKGVGMGLGLSVVGVVAAGVGLAVSKAGEAVVGFNSQLTSAKAAFTGLLGSAQAADTFLQDLQRFAATTPFEFQDVLRASQRFLGMGMEASKVIPLLRDIGVTVSAVGGGTEQINRVTLAIAQMQAKGKVSAEEMNQLSEAGVQGWKILADATGLPIGQLMKLAEQGEITSDVFISAIQKAANTPEMQALAKNMESTWQTATSNMADGVTQFLATAGRPLFDALTKAALATADWLTKSNDAKVIAAGLATVVQGLVSQWAFWFDVIGKVTGALSGFIAAVPGVQALGQAMFGVNQAAQSGAPAQQMQATAESAEAAKTEAAGLRAELTQLPKELVAINKQIADSEVAIKRNAQEMKANAAEMRDAKQAADDIKASFEAQIAPLEATSRALENQARSIKTQQQDIKAGYADLQAPLKAALGDVNVQLKEAKNQAADIKSAYADLQAPIRSALQAVQFELKSNKQLVDETKTSYAAQVEPLQKTVDALTKQYDAQRKITDLQARANMNALRLAMIAAEGDPSRRAALTLRLEQNALEERGLDLQKTIQDSNRQIKDLQEQRNSKGKDGKRISDEEYQTTLRLLQNKREDAQIQLELLNGTDKEALARAKVALATQQQANEVRTLNEQQQDIANEIAAIPLQQQIDALKTAETERLTLLNQAREVLEKQAETYTGMLDGLEAAEEAILKPIEKSIENLGKQQDAIQERLAALKAAEDAALAPLEKQAAAIQREQDAIKGKIGELKQAEEAALIPVQQRVKEIEAARDALQDEAARLADVKFGLEEAKRVASEHKAELQAALAAAEALAKVPPGTAIKAAVDDTRDLGAEMPKAEAAVALFETNVGVLFSNLGTKISAFMDEKGPALTKWWEERKLDISNTTGPTVAALETWLNEQKIKMDAWNTERTAAWNKFWQEKAPGITNTQEAVVAALSTWLREQATKLDAWNTERTAAWNGFWGGLKGSAETAWNSLTDWFGGALADLGSKWDEFWKNLPKPSFPTIPNPFGARVQQTSLGGGGGGLSSDQSVAIQAINEAADRYGIPRLIAQSLAKVESNFNPRARNQNGEDSVGLFQLNRQGGQGTGYSVEELMDPFRNAEIFLRDKKALLDRLAQLYSGAELAREFGRFAEGSAPGTPYGSAWEKYAEAYRQLSREAQTTQGVLQNYMLTDAEVARMAQENGIVLQKTALESYGGVQQIVEDAMPAIQEVTAEGLGVVATAFDDNMGVSTKVVDENFERIKDIYNVTMPQLGREAEEGGRATRDAFDTNLSATEQVVDENFQAILDTYNVTMPELRDQAALGSRATDILGRVAATAVRPVQGLGIVALGTAGAFDKQAEKIDDATDELNDYIRAAQKAGIRTKLNLSSNERINVEVGTGGAPSFDYSQFSPSDYGGGPMAEGGPVSAGVPYLVGERGPELFVPGLSGRVIDSASSMRALGGSTVVQQTHYWTIEGNVLAEDQFFNRLVDRFRRYSRDNAGDVF